MSVFRREGWIGSSHGFTSTDSVVYERDRQVAGHILYPDAAIRETAIVTTQAVSVI